jgi:hypothetical protein
MYFTYAVQAAVCGGAESCTVFVTSTTHTGDLGGLTGADTICQARAEAAGSLAAPGTYKAWLSALGVTTAAARLTHATVPYKLVDGATIANDWTDLTDGTLQAPFRVTEEGETITGAFSWTATSPDGNGTTIQDCVAWSDMSSDVFGAAGGVGSTDSRWSFGFTSACSSEQHLYCLQQ